jgi:hypothetical protein
MAAKRTEPKTKKTTTRKSGIRRKPVVQITQDDVATRAYYIHLEGGHDPFENWLRAERELAGI